jgi:tetratricopeptide (TPR) repeat protein
MSRSFVCRLSQFCIGAMCAALSLVAAGQSMPNMPGMSGGHHHHDDAPASMEKLGQVHFPVSCAAKSQPPFERGIALLHSFGYTLAEQQFQSIAEGDPTCAMAHWGVAMTQFRELWGRPDADALKTGASEMEKARAIAATIRITPREQAYIGALSDFYRIAPQSFQQGADAYAAAMGKLHAAYPQDTEGAAFYALSLLADVAPNDTSLTKEHQALAILVPLFEKNPDHPGLAHYIIHTCDTPALAPEGLEAAKEYAKIAPSSPHALHMPGHIFARLGMWQEDISSNLASVAASQKDEAEHQPGVAHQMHAEEFLVYAYLQTGQDAKARELTYQMRSIGEHIAALPGHDDMKEAGVYFDNELRVIYNMEMHDWKTLAALQPSLGKTNRQRISEFDIYWGWGVAAGHLHDAKLAATALAKYDEVLDWMKKSPYADSVDDAQIRRNEMVGWQAFIEGKPEAAAAAITKAADQQDKLGQSEVDIPAREMLGDLLLSLDKPQEALMDYQGALKLSPNRLNGLLSAGAAAEAVGAEAQARSYYEQVARNTDNGLHTSRPAVAHAIQFDTAHPTVAKAAAK